MKYRLFLVVIILLSVTLLASVNQQRKAWVLIDVDGDDSTWLSLTGDTMHTDATYFIGPGVAVVIGNDTLRIDSMLVFGDKQAILKWFTTGDSLCASLDGGTTWKNIVGGGGGASWNFEDSSGYEALESDGWGLEIIPAGSLRVDWTNLLADEVGPEISDSLLFVGWPFIINLTGDDSL